MVTYSVRVSIFLPLKGFKICANLPKFNAEYTVLYCMYCKDNYSRRYIISSVDTVPLIIPCVFKASPPFLSMPGKYADSLALGASSQVPCTRATTTFKLTYLYAILLKLTTLIQLSPHISLVFLSYSMSPFVRIG